METVDRDQGCYETFCSVCYSPHKEDFLAQTPIVPELRNPRIDDKKVYGEVSVSI